MKEIINAAEKAQILEEINNFNNRFETVIGERGVKLSGGQRQRLSIARTFYKKPEIFIFDDCLSAIDARKEQDILKKLKNESRGKTSIIISHRIATIKDSDYIIVLKGGKIIERGSHQALLKNKEFYSKMYKRQSRSG